MPATSVDSWLAAEVPGRSFVDVGGLWGVVAEKVTTAASYKAATLAMVDHLPGDHELWDRFLDRARAHGIDAGAIRLIACDVEAPEFPSTVGPYDVVHCNGLLYHTPTPVHFLNQLRSVTTRHLILGTVVLPKVILSRLGLPATQPLSIFVPALDAVQRRSVARAYAFPEHAPALGISGDWNSWLQLRAGDGLRYDAAPYWWLHTPATVEAMLRLVAFEVVERFPHWDDRLMYFLCRPTPLPPATD